MTPSIAIPIVPEQNTKALAAIDQANYFNITTQEDAAAVDAFCVNLKALEKEVDAAYDEHIDAAHKAHKSLVAKKKLYAEPIAEARRIAKGKLIAWDDKQKALAEQEAAIARAKAKRDAEDEALARAARAAEFGDDKTAEAIISAPVVVEPVKVAVQPKMETVFQTRWEGVIENASLIPREYLIPDMAKINGVVRSTKGAILIPGVRAVSRKV